MSYTYNPGDLVTVLNPAEPADTDILGTTADEALRQIKAYLKDPTQSPEVKINALRTRLNNVISSLGSSAGTITPTGTIVPFTSSSVPTGWLECTGAEVSRDTYASLFSVIGVTFGPGDESNTFNLPDLTDKFLGSIDPTFTAVQNATHANSLGTSTHQLTTNELPSHTHLADPENVRGLLGYNGAAGHDLHPGDAAALFHVSVDTTGTFETAGGDAPHNNTQPYTGVLFIIKT